MEVIRQIYPALNMTPGILLAPGWSENATVAAGLQAKTTGINGVFRAVCIVDVDSSTTGAKMYTGVKQQKEKQAITSANCYPVWLYAKVGDAQIDIGKTYVDVLAQAEVVGAGGNDIPPGVVDTLVDAIPYVAAVENTDTSSGGADVESDDSLTRRIWLSPTTYSCAGPKDAYEFWAMSFRSDVESAIAVSPRDVACTVYIFFMLTGGKMPSEKDMSEMQTYLMNEARRPMTDRVICKAPEEVEYSIDFTYYIGSGNSKGASIVQESVAKAVEEFQEWQRSIGRDINPMELIARLRAAGVKRVELRQPVDKVIENGMDSGKAIVQIPKLGGTPTIIYGGIEDD